MEHRVRRVATDELEEVGRLTVEAYRDDGYIDADDEYLLELADAAYRDREAEVWVAVDDTGVLGSVTFCPQGSELAEVARAGEGEFRMLGVTARARRRGVAEALVRRCVDRSRELGYDGLVMSSMAEMASAHRLYDRLGFRREPQRDWSPHEGLTLLAFSLRLG